MKIAIFYDSITGNTSKLAKSIYDMCADYDVSIYRDFNEEMLYADLIFAGSYTKNMKPSERAQKVYKKLAGKRIFLFGTCGYNYGDDYYDQILKNTCDYIPSNSEIVDYYYCLGKMPYSVRLKYEALLKINPNNQEAIEKTIVFDKALKHPDYDDLIDLEIKVKMILNDSNS